MVVPIYEEEQAGVYYNTAAVIDADGKYLGKYRKNHIPHAKPGFWEKFYFRPGNLGLPRLRDRVREGRRLHLLRPPLPRGRAGARAWPAPRSSSTRRRPWPGSRSTSGSSSSPRTPSPTATSSAPSTAWGTEAPWNIGEFYGQSYFCDPRGQILAEGPRDKDELVVAELDLDMIDEVRDTWQFFRDRRPDAYGSLVQP